MSIVHGANLALRFVLELCILASLGYWGFHTGDGVLLTILLGIGGPLLAAIVWGTFLSPKASVGLDERWKLALEVVVFTVAIVALYSTGKSGLAWIFAGLAILSRTLLYVWHQ